MGIEDKLHNVANCTVFSHQKKAPVTIHVGAQRLRRSVEAFLQQFPETSERDGKKKVFFAFGPPRSGKTLEASSLLPWLLEPHTSRIMKQKALAPVRKVYLDCSGLASQSWDPLETILYKFEQQLTIALADHSRRQTPRPLHPIDLMDQAHYSPFHIFQCSILNFRCYR